MNLEPADRRVRLPPRLHPESVFVDRPRAGVDARSINLDFPLDNHFEGGPGMKRDFVAVREGSDGGADSSPNPGSDQGAFAAAGQSSHQSTFAGWLSDGRRRLAFVAVGLN